MQKIPTILRS